MPLFLDLNGRRYPLAAKHSATEVVGMLDAEGTQRLNLSLANGGTLVVNVSTPCDWALEQQPE